MHALYRNTMVVARESLSAARQKRRAELEGVRPLGAAHAARIRRRASGWTLLLFAAGIAFVVILPAWAAFDPSLPETAEATAEVAVGSFGRSAERLPGLATLLLLASWPTAALAAAVGGRIAGWRFRRRIDRGLASLAEPRPGSPEESGEDAYAVLAALAEATPLSDQLIAGVRAQEGVSVAAWLAGASLCLPLSMHLAVALAASTMGVMIQGPGVLADVVRSFDGWITLSGLVAHAMAATALYAVAFARRLKHDPEALPNWQTPLILATAAAAVFPAVLLGLHLGPLGLLPVLLVFGTGAIFLPVLYGALTRALRRERFLIEAAEADVAAARA